MTSVVLGNDMVARMSVHAMANLREEVLGCIGKISASELRWALLFRAVSFFTIELRTLINASCTRFGFLVCLSR